MLVDGHEIESPLDRVSLWTALVDLDNIARWSALDACVSTDSGHLEPTSSYLCTHHGDGGASAASVEVVDFDPGACLALHTSTPMADLDERLELDDHLGGSLVVYSAAATSAAFGPPRHPVAAPARGARVHEAGAVRRPRAGVTRLAPPQLRQNLFTGLPWPHARTPQ